jgi:hypothetical protein
MLNQIIFCFILPTKQKKKKKKKKQARRKPIDYDYQNINKKN